MSDVMEYATARGGVWLPGIIVNRKMCVGCYTNNVEMLFFLLNEASENYGLIQLVSSVN